MPKPEVTNFGPLGTRTGYSAKKLAPYLEGAVKKFGFANIPSAGTLITSKPSINKAKLFVRILRLKIFNGQLMVYGINIATDERSLFPVEQLNGKLCFKIFIPNDRNHLVMLER